MLLFPIMLLILVWNLSKIVKSITYWWCRYHCSMRDKLYSPLRKYLKSLKQNEQINLQTTRRALARQGSSMSASSVKTSDTNEPVSKARNIPHIKNHKRIPSL